MFCVACGQRPLLGTHYCSNCGAETLPSTDVCVKCGVRVARVGDKELGTTVLLSLFLGVFGVDRFYLGYSGLGILKLLTLACCAFGLLVATLRYTWGADRATARTSRRNSPTPSKARPLN